MATLEFDKEGTEEPIVPSIASSHPVDPAAQHCTTVLQEFIEELDNQGPPNLPLVDPVEQYPAVTLQQIQSREPHVPCIDPYAASDTDDTDNEGNADIQQQSSAAEDENSVELQVCLVYCCFFAVLYGVSHVVYFLAGRSRELKF